MPVLKKNGEKQRWINHENRTAAFIRFFWHAASADERKSFAFLSFVIKAGWNNGNELKHPGTSIGWRNNNLAEYLNISWNGEQTQLIDSVVRHWPHLDSKVVKAHLDAPTGIVGYRKPFRPKLIAFLRRHLKPISQAFGIVSSSSGDPRQKVYRAMKLLDALPLMPAYNGGETSVLNGITAALACLDPHKCFPIVNVNTTSLLHSIGAQRDAEGVILLIGLIGQYNIATNLELDVYSQWYSEIFPINRKRKLTHKINNSQGREVGEKSEAEGYAELSKRKVKIRKEHNQLINKFRSTIIGKYHVLRESVFDVLIQDWKKDRMLLVEAKTGTRGASGRSQLRQAIGQLFDYRYTCFPGRGDVIDLALLTPDKPQDDVLSLLESLNIYALWFAGDKLGGTIVV